MGHVQVAQGEEKLRAPFTLKILPSSPRFCGTAPRLRWNVDERLRAWLSAFARASFSCRCCFSSRFFSLLLSGGFVPARTLLLRLLGAPGAAEPRCRSAMSCMQILGAIPLLRLGLVRLVQPSLPLPFRHELLLQILPDKEGIRKP